MVGVTVCVIVTDGVGVISLIPDVDGVTVVVGVSVFVGVGVGVLT
jgi:hypothetical protein